jgi:hypothetical protein
MMKELVLADIDDATVYIDSLPYFAWLFVLLYRIFACFFGSSHKKQTRQERQHRQQNNIVIRDIARVYSFQGMILCSRYQCSAVVHTFRT